MRSADRFARLVRDALRALPPRVLAHFDAVDVAIGDLPARTTDDEIVLAIHEPVDPGAPGSRHRITLFRRPLEARARDRADLHELVREVLVQQLAELRGLDDDDLDALGWP